MNKTSLAKAIGIVFGIIAAITALGFLLEKYDALAMLGILIIIAALVITLLWQCIMMVYDAIEDKRYD
jgi:hypothetical protein